MIHMKGKFILKALIEMFGGNASGSANHAPSGQGVHSYKFAHLTLGLDRLLIALTGTK